MTSISFRQKRLPCRSVSDCSRLFNCLYRKQSGKYSAKWDRSFRGDLPALFAYRPAVCVFGPAPASGDSSLPALAFVPSGEAVVARWIRSAVYRRWPIVVRCAPHSFSRVVAPATYHTQTLAHFLNSFLNMILDISCNKGLN